MRCSITEVDLLQHAPGSQHAGFGVVFRWALGPQCLLSKAGEMPHQPS